MRPALRLSAAEHVLIAQLADSPEGERLAVAGLPTRRVESYHYTDLKSLLKAVPPMASPTDVVGAPALPVPGAFRLAIVNGTAGDTPPAPTGVIVGRSEGGALSGRDDVLVRLNTALARESLSLTLEGQVDPVIHLDRRTEGPASHAVGSARVFLADGGSATVLETFSGSDAAHVANHATYLALGRNARLTHVAIDLSAGASTHFSTHEYHLAEGAQLRTLTIHLGSALSRMNVFTRFDGEGAHADLTGLNLTSDGQHSDITLDLGHAVPRCTSQPMYKQIGRGRSRAVFQGRIVVARDAQKTDAKMMMQGLMLSDEAEILSKPELEIYADDVVCGHGSTCGALDEDSLFYLVSRGIPKAEAETMLVRGFLAEVLDPIEDGALREALEAVVDRWLQGSA